MSTLTVLLPNGKTVGLIVADDTLVYDGSQFKSPNTLKYAMLYAVPVEAMALPFKTVPSRPLSVQQHTRAEVIGIDPIPATPTDPSLISEPDPSNGVCICFVTCQGTHLSYVQVTTL